jgi:hypothetical protein
MNVSYTKLFAQSSRWGGVDTSSNVARIHGLQARFTSRSKFLAFKLILAPSVREAGKHPSPHNSQATQRAHNARNRVEPSGLSH